MKWIFSVALLVFGAALAVASPFSTIIAGGATTECGASGGTFGPEQPPLGVGSDSISSGPCVVLGVLQSASASASVNATGTTSQIAGSAASQGVGAVAGASASYSDTVTLNSPQINFTGGVNVIISDAYTLDLSGVGSAVGAGGEVEIALAILGINGLQAPVSDRAFQGALTNGTYTGQLNVNFSISSCPCNFLFQLSGDADVASGVSADFQDPIVITLPPGWTYTLASQTVGAVATPEPGTSLGLTGFGLLTIGLQMYLRRHEQPVLGRRRKEP
jgi:hypothetical protein